MVCRLNRSIYGLKQSGACWERKLVNTLTTMGFEKCITDPCLFKIKWKGQTLFLTVYVDDIVFASSSEELRTWVMGELRKHFEVTDTGDLTWILNTSISQNLKAGTVSLSQKTYIEDMMNLFLPDEITKAPRKAPSMPCNETIQDLINDTAESVPDPLYPRGVGKLLWLVVMTRFDHPRPC